MFILKVCKNSVYSFRCLSIECRLKLHRELIKFSSFPSSYLTVYWEAGASKTAFLSRSSRRYTQVLETRHSGQGCRTNWQDCQFARLCRPQGEAHGCAECIHRPRMANCGSRPMYLYPQTVNYCLASPINQALAQPTGYRPWPGFRHPCRNDGFSDWLDLAHPWGLLIPIPPARISGCCRAAPTRPAACRPW